MDIFSFSSEVMPNMKIGELNFCFHLLCVVAPVPFGCCLSLLLHKKKEPLDGIIPIPILSPAGC